VKHSKVHTDKHLSDNFPTQNCIKQGDALSPLIFNFASEYAFRKIQENQMGPKLNGTHRLLFYADDVNLLGDNIDTIKKCTETFIDAIKVGLEINIEGSTRKHMLLSRHQSAGPNHDTKIATVHLKMWNRSNIWE
jgi:hypothetical protein